MGLTGEDVREAFEVALPGDILEKLAELAGLVQRERKQDAVKLMRSMVVAAATGYGGRQADVMRAYLESGAKPVVRGGFYAWFGKPLERAMSFICARMLEYVRSHPVDLPGFLGEHVRDWHIVDSTTVQLDDALKDIFPGTGDYAALKVHKRFSVGHGTLWGYHVGPAREHDARHLEIDESWRGLGLLVDLGYASLKLLADCALYDVKFVIRLKDNWKPRVDQIHRGEVAKTFFAGTDLDALLDDGVILLNGQAIDTSVTLGRGAAAVSCRLVGVPVQGGAYRFYLTSLPRRVGPLQIAQLYRVRWEIESDNKLDKSCSRLDKIGARTEHAVRALVHASMVSSMLSCVIVHKARLKDAPPSKQGTEKTTPPLHPQTLARAMGAAAGTIAAALDRTGADALREWGRIAAYLEHLGFDPNWRRNPSILDQLRGWKISPGRPRNAKRSAPVYAN